MPIPYDTIRQHIKEKRITRINQLFEYGTIPEWKEYLGFRKGLLERIIEDPKRITYGLGHRISMATGLKVTVVNRLVEGQRKYNWAMKRAGGQKGEPGELPPGRSP